jgi:hypothetical protein
METLRRIREKYLHLWVSQSATEREESQQRTVQCWAETTTIEKQKTKNKDENQNRGSRGKPPPPSTKN